MALFPFCFLTLSHRLEMGAGGDLERKLRELFSLVSAPSELSLREKFVLVYDGRARMGESTLGYLLVLVFTE